MTQPETAKSTLSDAELIAAVQRGDSEAYGTLYERHAGAARTVAGRYLASADADDVVADAFARVLALLQEGRGPTVAFRAYLFTVVRRMCYDLASRRRRDSPVTDPRSDRGTAEDPALARFERSVVTHAFKSLPERWQAVLWYTEVEDLPPARIAPLLGLTANGVSALSYRAREGLRQAYLQEHLQSASGTACRSVTALLGGYVRGGVAQREQMMIDEHLITCTACRDVVVELTDVSHGMRTVIAPLVLGTGAMGLVGRSLPLAGGGAVGGGLGAVGGSVGSAGLTGSVATGLTSTGLASVGTGAGSAAMTGGISTAATAGGASTALGAGGASAVFGGFGVVTGAGTAVAGPLPLATVAVTVAAAAGLGFVGVVGALSGSTTTPTVIVAEADPSPTVTAAPPATTPTPTDLPADSGGVAPAVPVEPAPVAEQPVDPPSPDAVSPGVTPTPAQADEPPPGADVPSPDASVDVSLQTVTMVARRPVDLHVVAVNSGDAAAEGVWVDLLLPAGLDDAETKVSVGGTAVPGGFLTDPECAPGIEQPDETEIVTCSVGALAAHESRDLEVAVTARRGGEYAIEATVRSRGHDPVRKQLGAVPVSYFGAQLRSVDIAAVPVANPGTALVEIPIRNVGDRSAVGPQVTIKMPRGVALVADTQGEQQVGDWTCTSGRRVTCVAPQGLTIDPGERALLRFELATDGSRAGGIAQLHVAATAAGARSGGSRLVRLAVERRWEGVGDIEFTSRCVGKANRDLEARAVLVSRATVPQTVWLETEWGPGEPVAANAGRDRVAVSSRVPARTGARDWAGTATVVVTRTFARVTYRHAVTGRFPVLTCGSSGPAQAE